MTNSKPAELDKVLQEYALASEDFDANVLHSFVGKYPEHAPALRRYAQVQLTFVEPTREEIEAEELTDEEMLPQQSRLLQRMQQLRALASAEDISAASAKLAEISGVDKLVEAAQAVFGSSEHGEDLLLVSVTDSPVPVNGVPDWFYERLGRSVDCAPAAVVQALALKRNRPTASQRFSTQGKPVEAAPITWKQLVEDCLSDGDAKQKILKNSIES